VGTVQSGLPGSDFWHGITVNLLTPWLGKFFLRRNTGSWLISPSKVLTIVFNILTTSMIAVRLALIRRSMRGVLSKERAEVYTGVIAILVESALPFTLLGIAYLITYVRTDPEALAFADVWGAFVVSHPCLV
jgi:predicted ferric reductase